MGDIYFERLQRRLRHLVYETTKVQLCSFGSHVWSPPLNVYRCPHCMVICVDLAGVDKSAIQLQVEPKRLLIRGRREHPTPGSHAGAPMQVLDMEIDCGPFEREILFPVEVETGSVSADQSNGLLWIHLPVRSQA